MIRGQAVEEEPAWAELRPVSEAPARVFETSARGIDERPAAEPSPIGIVAWTAAILALIIGATVVLRRVLRRSGLLAADGLIRVSARRSVGPRQHLLLVEVEGKRLLIGASRDRLVTLAELAAPAEPKPARDPATYEQVAGEVAEIRRTVESWRS